MYIKYIKHFLIEKNNQIFYRNLSDSLNNDFNLIEEKLETKYKDIIPNYSDILKIKELCLKNKIDILNKNSFENLKNNEYIPYFFFVQGNKDLLNNKSISFTGTRKPSKIGVNLAEKFTKVISNLGFISIAGLAEGIDAVVHKNSIRNGTIAVIGSGLLEIYPKTNIKLYNDILSDNGLILSQFLPQEKPKPLNFLERNKIIVSLSRLLILVQSSLRSGSMMTARFANKINKNIIYSDSTSQNFEGNIYLKSKDIGQNIQENFNEEEISRIISLLS